MVDVDKYVGPLEYAALFRAWIVDYTPDDDACVDGRDLQKKE